jgi:hypothetical protein
MKVTKIGLLVTAICMSLWAVTAFADSADNVRADVPFAFYAGNHMFPAGNYVFSVDDQEAPRLLTIESQNGERHGFVLTDLRAEAKNQVINKTELVFNLYGTQHFLSEVQLQGDDQLRTIPESNLERSQNHMNRQRITVDGQKG